VCLSVCVCECVWCVCECECVCEWVCVCVCVTERFLCNTELICRVKQNLITLQVTSIYRFLISRTIRKFWDASI